MSARKKKVAEALSSLFSEATQQDTPPEATRRTATAASAPGDPPATHGVAMEKPAAPTRQLPAQEAALPVAPQTPAATPTRLAQGSTSPGTSTPQSGATDNQANAHHQMVVFILANEHFGIDIAEVESIIKLQPMTPVPRAHPYVEGVTNLRGTVLPVLDLRKRFDLPVSDSTRDTRIVVLNLNGEKIGLIVDAVSEVVRVPANAIDPPPALISQVESEYLRGVARLGGANGHSPDGGPDANGEERLVILLDLQKAFPRRG